MNKLLDTYTLNLIDTFEWLNNFNEACFPQQKMEFDTHVTYYRTSYMCLIFIYDIGICLI